MFSYLMDTAMSQPQAAPASKPKFDNQGQYSRTSILRYEKIFGEHYISTGGAETTDNLCRRLGGSLRPGVPSPRRRQRDRRRGVPPGPGRTGPR